VRSILMISNCILLLIISAISVINASAIELKNGTLVCNQEECKTTEKVFSFHGLEIKTSFTKVYPEHIKKLGISHFASIKVLKDHDVLWEYKEDLDPSGDPNVGISLPPISPDKKVMAITVIGNYTCKIILIFSDHHIDTFNGGHFIRWEKNGGYIFTPIDEDTPMGFIIYDLHKRKIIFKTDKLIIDWEACGNEEYILTEYPNMLEDIGADRDKTNCYKISLSSEKIELQPYECKKKIESEKKK
jgi:hypothetical protein